MGHLSVCNTEVMFLDIKIFSCILTMFSGYGWTQEWLRSGLGTTFRKENSSEGNYNFIIIFCKLGFGILAKVNNCNF